MGVTVKPKRCTFCKQLVFPWQPAKEFRTGDKLHEKCAADVRKIWKQDMERPGA
jgi:hypothetical protein